MRSKRYYTVDRKVLYSELRKSFDLKRAGDDLASFSHYLQTFPNGVSSYFRSGAEEFLEESQLFDNLRCVPEIEFDIPFPPPQNPSFSFIDLFAGIGGMRLAFQRLGGKCLFSSEWNAFAKQTYEANFGEVPFGDIVPFREKDIPDHDLLVAGFPCQPFSIAGVTKKNALGRKHGFLDETQGTLFFDIARILKEKQPKAFILENVKNLRSHDKGNTFKIIAKTLDQLGYSVTADVLDGKYFVPQHRERIIIVGFRYDTYAGWEQFRFPEMRNDIPKFASILDDNPPERYTLTQHLWNYLQAYAKKHRAKGNGFGFGLTKPEGIARTLSARYYKDGAEILVDQPGGRPRRLTPRECARLQGFPDEFVIPVSDTQAYKQFGNSVVVPMIQAIGASVIATMKERAYGAARS